MQRLGRLWYIAWAITLVAALSATAGLGQPPPTFKSRGVLKNYDGRGVVYLRTDARGSYVGQAESQVRFARRQQEHIDKEGRVFEFRALSRPLRPELDMVEAHYIRKF